MTGQWEGSTRRDELPDDWPDRRALVMQRDHYRCRWVINAQSDERCGTTATDVDHIGDRNDHRLINLQALCREHHAIKSSREGTAARWQHRRARPPERHPGLIGDQPGG